MTFTIRHIFKVNTFFIERLENYTFFKMSIDLKLKKLFIIGTNREDLILKYPENLWRNQSYF